MTYDPYGGRPHDVAPSMRWEICAVLSVAGGAIVAWLFDQFVRTLGLWAWLAATL